MKILILTKQNTSFQKYPAANAEEYIHCDHSFWAWNEAFLFNGHRTFLNWEESYFLSPFFKQKFPFIYRFINFFMRFTGIKRLDRFLFSKKIAKFCNEKHIDAIFTEINSSISPRLIKKWMPKLICTEWIGLFPDSLRWDDKQFASEYDIVFSPIEVDPAQSKFKKFENFKFIRCSFCEELFFHDYDPAYAYDVVFVGGIGSRHKNRIDYLEAVAANFENFAFFGYGAEYLPASSKLKKKFKGWATVDIVRKLFSSSKLAINLTLDNYEKATRGFNARLFEIAACGGAMQICRSDQKIHEFFDVGEELETFSDKEELVLKTNLFLDDNILREKIVEKSLVKSKIYTHRNAVKDLLASVEEMRSSKCIKM